jgi:hypothetical protein
VPVCFYIFEGRAQTGGSEILPASRQNSRAFLSLPKEKMAGRQARI